MADPFAELRYMDKGVYWNEEKITEDPWTALRKRLRQYPLQMLPDVPPFRGGAVGYVGYELNQTLEALPPARRDEFDLPSLWVHFYDVVTVYDHERKTATIYSSGYPENVSSKRQARAQERTAWWAEKLTEAASLQNRSFATSQAPHWSSNFSRESYIHAVDRIREWIAAGDIFQANFSQRFTAELPDDFDAVAFYQHSRKINAAPFGAYFQYPDLTIASVSPERFLRLSGRTIEARPIKGTRPRHAERLLDAELAAELQASRKDRSENTMIVDLLRNDLSKVCIPGSVAVPVLCGLESYASVHHLVSIVQGELKPGLHAVDVVKSAFPGGSITGAPKKRAMEIIQELEGIPRHVYCGCLGFWGFDGQMDTNIAIRTILIKGGKAWFQTGGGIVYLSDGAEEYQESLDKAARIFTAFQP